MKTYLQTQKSIKRLIKPKIKTIGMAVKYKKANRVIVIALE